MKDIIQRLFLHKPLRHDEFVTLLDSNSEELRTELADKACSVRSSVFGKDIYIRGLIEFTNYCKNNCYYCGIRAGNSNAVRYRLEMNDILSCCENGHSLGFRTFVLQGGEDPYYTDDVMVEIVSAISKKYPDCAITLSIGEKSRESYKRLFDAGADRYLLREETSDEEHYKRLHPDNMSFNNRMECLRNLKEIGYQVGCGFMVGSPYQTHDNLASDLCFIQEFRPHMVGIGPYITHADTPFADMNNGTLEDTLLLISILRLMDPELLLPATTSLGTIHPLGREMGIKAGANVVMPNLSPVGVRKQYMLYDNKICTGEEAAECVGCMDRRMEAIGYKVVTSRGDSPRL
ncbi:MAG: [Lachnospiraceae bacterium]|nr:[FeFe] hydrogenase H-cluster radical SAM maturase HydE [Lachnospiraceae bacterium]